MLSATAPAPSTSSWPPASPSEADDPGFGLYIHWPFCLSKCPYCDFNSHVRDKVDTRRWRKALLLELDHFARDMHGRRVTSIFFGGGTPSLMAPETVAAVIGRAAAHWSLAPDVEITLEANPTSVEAARLHDFRGAGINRLSLGVQSLDDPALEFLGRRHSAREALAALDVAADTFARTSFDLIYALPGQDAARWRAELTRALEYVGGHLSVYQLTIEPGTAFHARHGRGELGLPDADEGADLYEATQEILEDAGLPAYEVSNHARPGQACRHNVTTWRHGDYVGVGPGAHGRVTGSDGLVATRQHRAPEAWLSLVEQHGHGTRERTPVTGEALRDEMFLMGLRLTDGVRRSDLERRLGRDLEELIEPKRLQPLLAAKFLVIDDIGVRTTPAGRLRLDAVTAALLA